MLKTTITKTISGQSTIDNQLVATMNATIRDDGTHSNINSNIMNSTLYEANKEEVRADIQAFEDLVYAEEDSDDEVQQEQD